VTAIAVVRRIEPSAPVPDDARKPKPCYAPGSLEWGEDQRPGKGSGAGLTKPHAKMRAPSADPCACRSPHHCVVVRKTNKTCHLEHQQSARLLISCHRSRTYTSELARSQKHGDNGPTVGWFARSRHPGFRPAARLVDFAKRIRPVAEVCLPFARRTARSRRFRTFR
jgi:hypothetical protein